MNIPTLIFQGGDTVLHEALRREELEMVELLLESPKIDLNQKNKVFVILICQGYT